FETSFENFVGNCEMKKEERGKPINVISLEISGTALADEVRAPKLVREVDMVKEWPDERKQREIIFEPVEVEGK
ncbi:hypothetical protein PENTCL1PPCAC_25944, partial [Pristionchus entomophagus]